MPLKTGSKNIRANISELTHGKVGATRKKAIATLAAKRGISKEQARFYQALAIARSQAKKK